MAKVFRITVTQTVSREVRITAPDAETALDRYFNDDFDQRSISDLIVAETDLRIDGILVRPNPDVTA